MKSHRHLDIQCYTLSCQQPDFQAATNSIWVGNWKESFGHCHSEQPQRNMVVFQIPSQGIIYKCWGRKSLPHVEATGRTLDWIEAAKLSFTLTALWSNLSTQPVKLPFYPLENNHYAEKHGWETTWFIKSSPYSLKKKCLLIGIHYCS